MLEISRILSHADFYDYLKADALTTAGQSRMSNASFHLSCVSAHTATSNNHLRPGHQAIWKEWAAWLVSHCSSEVSLAEVSHFCVQAAVGVPLMAVMQMLPSVSLQTAHDGQLSPLEGTICFMS